LQQTRIARNASQPRIGAKASAATGMCSTHWTRCGTNVLLGRPSRQGERQFIAIRLILMGVWRDSSQPFVEETGAVSWLHTE